MADPASLTGASRKTHKRGNRGPCFKVLDKASKQNHDRIAPFSGCLTKHVMDGEKHGYMSAQNKKKRQIFLCHVLRAPGQVLKVS